jgi:thiol-disulfide isomerase/thioredoxin
MKKILTRSAIAAMILAMSIGLYSLWQHEAQTPPPPDFGPVPPISALDENGQPFAGWPSLRQPAVIVTLWASWCSVCIAELPKKLEYIAQHPNTALVAISIDTDRAAMQTARAKLGAISGTVVWLHDADKRGAYKPLQATGVPETFILDAKRHIRAKQNGPTDLLYGPLAGALEYSQKP